MGFLALQRCRYSSPYTVSTAGGLSFRVGLGSVFALVAETGWNRDCPETAFGRAGEGVHGLSWRATT